MGWVYLFFENLEMQVGINTNMGGGVNFSNFYRNTQNRATGSYPKSVPPPEKHKNFSINNDFEILVKILVGQIKVDFNFGQF